MVQLIDIALAVATDYRTLHSAKVEKQPLVSALISSIKQTNKHTHTHTHIHTHTHTHTHTYNKNFQPKERNLRPEGEVSAILIRYLKLK